MAGEFLLDFEPVVLARQAGWPRPACRVPEWAPATVLLAGPPPPRRRWLAALRYLLLKLMNTPQLQRDLREVENELRLARTRLAHYNTLGEQELATDCRRVVLGHEQLRDTLTARILSLLDASKD